MKRIPRVYTYARAALLTAALSVVAHAQDPLPENTEEATKSRAPTNTAPSVRVTDTADSKEAIVSMAFDETPLADVIKAFRDATGANIISGGTNLQANISVRLDNVPWRKGLSSILDPQGLQLVEQPAGSEIYVINNKTLEVPKFTRVFNLEYVKAIDVADLFKATLNTTGGVVTPFKESNAIILTGTEQQISECEEIITAIDKPSPQVYIEVRFVELSAAASRKLGMKWDSLGTEDGWGASFNGASLGYGTSSGKSKTSGRNNTLGSSQLSSADSSSSSDSGSSRNQANDILNLTDTGNTLSSIASTRSSEISRELSSTFDSTRTHSRDRVFSGSLSMDAFSLALNAFEQMDGASIFSNPKIIVANEKEAMIDMTTKEPNLTVTSSRTGTTGDQLDITATLEAIPGEKGDKDGMGKGLFAGEVFFSYGLILKVTPRISSSGLITLNIEPSISNFERYYEFSGIDSSTTPTPKYPIIYMQRLQTVFTMNSGTTAVIGGLTKTTESNVDSGIPWLRKLPWVGPRLFGWKSRGKDQKEIIIFVTVNLADPMTIKEDAGMPKNAILGRDLFTGALKEPGDRTKEEVMSLSDKPLKKSRQSPTEPITASKDGSAALPAPEMKPLTVKPLPATQPISEREAAGITPTEIPLTPLLQTP